MTVEIICADARAALAAMPEGSVHTCVTSPPYWGLRDYGLEPTVWGDTDCEHAWGEELPGDPRGGSGPGAKEKDTYARQVARGNVCGRCDAWRGTLGLEPTPDLYVEHIVQMMREVRRVLRDDGTLWLNLGDSYAGSGPSGASYQSETTKRRAAGDGTDGNFRVSRTLAERGLSYIEKKPIPPPGLKPKDLCGMPWRVAFALQSDGWWLRSDIVWSKPNPMPESVRDRPTRAHEYVFLLSKSQRYFYDADAIREQDGGGRSSNKERKYRSDHGGVEGHPSGQGFGVPWESDGSGRNKRSVWEIPTQPYPEAHFAVFPEKLVEPCILAGTSERGCCPECGAPWERVVAKGGPASSHKGSRFDHGKTAARDGGDRTQGGDRYDTNTVGWRPTCDHLRPTEKPPYGVSEPLPPVPCTVLDPFSGSGTVGVVAERLGQHSVLIDAKDEYCEMARHRTAQRGLMKATAS